EFRRVLFRSTAGTGPRIRRLRRYPARVPLSVDPADGTTHPQRARHGAVDRLGIGGRRDLARRDQRRFPVEPASPGVADPGVAAGAGACRVAVWAARFAGMARRVAGTPRATPCRLIRTQLVTPRPTANAA